MCGVLMPEGPTAPAVVSIRAPLVLEGPEVESESTNDEQNMSDVLGHGDPLPGAR